MTEEGDRSEEGEERRKAGDRLATNASIAELVGDVAIDHPYNPRSNLKSGPGSGCNNGCPMMAIGWNLDNLTLRRFGTPKPNEAGYRICTHSEV